MRDSTSTYSTLNTLRHPMANGIKKNCRSFFGREFSAVAALLLAAAWVFMPSWAHANGKTRLKLYRDRQVTSGYFQEVDVQSPFYMPLVGGPNPSRRSINLPPRAGTYRRWRTFLADSHYGIRILPKQTCQDCHPRQSRDKHTIRGRITCSQCHGEDPIAGINHYYSKMNLTRRHSTVCAKCHEGASNSFASYVVHAPNPTEMSTQYTFPMLFYAFWAIFAVAVGTFVVFLPHTFIWGIRDYMTTPKHGVKPSLRIKRFSLQQRLFHLLLILSFLILTATGFSRMFIETQWGRFLAFFFGGYQGAIVAHKWTGIFILSLFGVHMLYVASKIDWRRFPKSLMGPDSILPQWPDLRLAIQHLGWLVGRSPHPRFDRWGYWEKFDYWAVFWGMMILGGTGLFMAYSLSLTKMVPGWTLNVALWLHRIEAVLAVAHVFIIHFFIAHARRHSFPMDRAMFEGSVDLEAVRHEKPAWIERLEKDGQLEANLVPEAGQKMKWLYYVMGLSAVGIGLFLLIGAIIHVPFITW